MRQPCLDEEDGVQRGWICHACNLMLGHARNNSDILYKASEYIDYYQHFLKN